MKIASDRPLLLAALALLQADLPAFAPDAIDPQATHVRPSTISGAGSGLFAAVDLPANSLVALYPVDAIGIDAGGQIDLAASAEDMQFFAGSDSNAYRVYCRHADQIVVDANPTKNVAPIFSAHRVNDAAACSSRDAASIEQYLEQTIAGQNCALVPVSTRAPLIACLTTQPVPAGAELFICYGPSYWVGGPPVGYESHGPRRPRSSDVLDAAYWRERSGTPRTAVLLDECAAVQQRAEAAAERSTVVAALSEGLDEAVRCVREMAAEAHRIAESTPPSVADSDPAGSADLQPQIFAAPRRTQATSAWNGLEASTSAGADDAAAADSASRRLHLLPSLLASDEVERITGEVASRAFDKGLDTVDDQST